MGVIKKKLYINSLGDLEIGHASTILKRHVWKLEIGNSVKKIFLYSIYT